MTNLTQKNGNKSLNVDATVYSLEVGDKLIVASSETLEQIADWIIDNDCSEGGYVNDFLFSGFNLKAADILDEESKAVSLLLFK